MCYFSRNTNKIQLCNRIYYSKVYWRLKMFRAVHRSSSGALNCVCSLWFIYLCGDRPLPRLSGKWISISRSALTPLIIRSSKLCLQPLVYIPMWWPAVAKAEWEMDFHFPLSRGNGQSPNWYINQRLQTQFRAPDDERCAARNMLSLQ